MNLYKISQRVNNDYDTYDSAVVAAESEGEAVKIHPDGTYDYPEGEHKQADRDYGTWAKKEYVKAELVGEAIEGLGRCVVVASFNAG